ncbi:MAG: 30S ribosomal protein S11 [bacterium]|nr:30S ribosomal protein S11 [bacterium]
MGKKRIIKKTEAPREGTPASRTRTSSRKKLARGFVYIKSTYNNTLITLTDEFGNAFAQNSSGGSGFSGSKKGTPYAASKAADLLSERARDMGVADIDLRVKGTGPGREAALRVFGNKGFNITSIKDLTPMPHGFMKARKPRRV